MISVLAINALNTPALSAMVGMAQLPSSPSPVASPPPLEPDSTLIDHSPVFQRWLQEVPDVLHDIRHAPSFRTRARIGYAHALSAHQPEGWYVGIEDGFVGHTGVTVSGDYQQSFEGDRKTYGANVRYYLLPLGSVVNLAPTLGYRHLATRESHTTEGMDIGIRLMFVLSRPGAADIALSQRWVAPGTESEVSLTTLSFGYAVTPQVRLSTDWQFQNADHLHNNQVGMGLEWMF